MSNGTRAQMPRPDPAVRRMLRVDQVADLLACSKDTVRRLVRDGKLEAGHVRHGIRVYKDSVVAYQEEAG